MIPVFNKISTRAMIAFGHDIFMSALAFLMAMYLRLGDQVLENVNFLGTGMLISCCVSAVVFYLMGLYRGVWRYASINDLIAITKSASLAILISALALFLLTRLEEFPRSVPLINWFVLMALLGGPRFIYRLFKDRHLELAHMTHDIKGIPVLLIGAGDAAELFLRALKRNPTTPYIPVGLLAESKSRLGLDIHGVSVIATVDDLEHTVRDLEAAKNKPQRLILAKDDWPGEKVRELLDISEKLGVPLSRLPKMTHLNSGAADQIDVRPIDVEDLLGRPQKALDRNAPKSLIEGRRVLVTGAGGSIGSELVRQICQNGPTEVLMLEASEFALYTIDMEVSVRFGQIKRQSRLCNIRDLDALDRVFTDFKPDIVFHAAALKHVPLVEDNPLEGIFTNIVGTKNVADVCIKHNVGAMVQISTDKAVNPTNVMGATKRIAEIYTQALDLDKTHNPACRFITVRFGNVLGSTGSVVPLFQKQLAEGGPITVTHKEMKRYFMTIREAVELVLQASVMSKQEQDLEGKICVLDMGEPVTILHLAEQMIRLAGFVPYQDIDIEITGLRPGEKLFEEIFHGDEKPLESSIEGILISAPRFKTVAEIRGQISRLTELENESALIKKEIQAIIPEYQPQSV